MSSAAQQAQAFSGQVTIHEAKQIIKSMFRTQIETGVRFSVELESGPGQGKSEGVFQITEELTKEWGQPVGFKSFFLSTVEQPDVAGLMMPVVSEVNGRKHVEMIRAKSPLIPKEDEPEYGITLLDEFRQAYHDVQKPAAEYLLNGRIGESILPITWFVVAASNRDSDRSGVQRALAFIENRRMLLTVKPSLDAWVDWAERKAVHPFAIAFAKTRVGVVFQSEVPKDSGPFCTPRSLVKVSHLINTLSPAQLTHAAMGYLGAGAGAEFVSFMRLIDEIPTYEEIIDDPMKTKVPVKSDANYALMQMLSDRMSDDDAGRALTYLSRMGREFQVACIRSTLRRNPQIATCNEFSQWIAKNSDLVKAAHAL